MDEELYYKVGYIVEMGDHKRSSWIRKAIENRVQEAEELYNITEEEYEAYKRDKETKHS